MVSLHQNRSICPFEIGYGYHVRVQREGPKEAIIVAAALSHNQLHYKRSQLIFNLVLVEAVFTLITSRFFTTQKKIATEHMKIFQSWIFSFENTTVCPSIHHCVREDHQHHYALHEIRRGVIDCTDALDDNQLVLILVDNGRVSLLDGITQWRARSLESPNPPPPPLYRNDWWSRASSRTR